LKRILIVTFFLLCLVSCVPESAVSSVEQHPPSIEPINQELLGQFGWFSQVITSYRMWQINCTDAYPEKTKEYASAFDGENFVLLENAMTKFLVDPRAEWEARKNDNTLFDEYEPPSLDECKQLLNGVNDFVRSLDSNESDRQNVNKLINFVSHLNKLTDQELESFFEDIEGL